MKVFFALFLVWTISPTAIAEDIPQVLIDSIHSMLLTEKVLNDAKKECLNQNMLPSAESLVTADPNYFGGITPRSSKWPKVMEIYKTYSIKSCEYLNGEHASKQFTKDLLSHYTVNEALELEKLLKSTAGQKYLESSLEANRKLQEYLYGLLSKQQPELSKWFANEIAKLNAGKP